MLHPHYRGHLLQKSGVFDEVKTKLIDSHPSTDEFNQKQEENERQKDTQAPITSKDTDDLDIFTMDTWTPNQTTGQNTSQCIPEIERELNIFFQMPPIQEGMQVDVLAWWKKQQVNLPLLAAVARGAYCVPAASSSSERVFSASGGIVTDKRYNLATGTLKMLTLSKVNYDFVADIMTLKTMSREEECEQIKQQLLSDLQMTPCTSAQTPSTSASTSKTKTQTKLTFKTVNKPVNKHKLICLSTSDSNTPSPEDSPPKEAPVRKITPCLPPGFPEGKGKGKGKSSLTPSQKRQASEMDTQELPPTQIRKRPRSSLTPKEIQESIDMFDNIDDESNDPDFNL